MSKISMDAELEARLRALYRLELERAATDLRAAPISQRRRSLPSPGGVLAAGFSGVAIAAALLVALSFRPGLGTIPGAGAGTTGATSTLTPGASASLQDGIPVTIEGQPVLTGGAIVDAIGGSTDDTSFLIGGWFPAGDDFRTYCTALAPGPASCTPYALHLSKGSEESVFVYPSGAATDIASYMATQPVVMRVHTHDRSCRSLPKLDGCENRLVLEEIVWLGPRS